MPKAQRLSDLIGKRGTRLSSTPDQADRIRAVAERELRRRRRRRRRRSTESPDVAPPVL